MTADSQERLLSWFEDEELRLCPQCREKKLLAAPVGVKSFCLDCGIVADPSTPA